MGYGVLMMSLVIVVSCQKGFVFCVLTSNYSQLQGCSTQPLVMALADVLEGTLAPGINVRAVVEVVCLHLGHLHHHQASPLS